MARVLVAVLYVLGAIVVMAWRSSENARAELTKEARISPKLGLAMALTWPLLAAYLGVVCLWDGVSRL